MAAAPDSTASVDELVAALCARLPPEAIRTDRATLEALSADLSYLPNRVASVVVAPGSQAELAAAHAARRSVYVRGGGMSFTSGYTPAQDGALLLDLRRLDRIEIHERDMYVVAEAGVTWLALDAALAAKGLRTPYWGPLSGRFATVGGALSQNSVFHGAALHRTAADSVVGLEVVLADGSLVRTGSWAHVHGLPSARTFGPDLTGLFLGDTGAFGVKAAAALRLIERPAHTAYLSYRCATLEMLLRCKTRISRLMIASECFGFDRRYNAALSAASVSLREGASAIAAAAAQGGLRGLASAARIAAAGRGVLDDVPSCARRRARGLVAHGARLRAREGEGARGRGDPARRAVRPLARRSAHARRRRRCTAIAATPAPASRHAAPPYRSFGATAGAMHNPTPVTRHERSRRWPP